MSTQQPQFLTLLLLVSFGSVGATLFTPGLPMIAHYFQVNMASAQLTITLFLIGYAVGQLLYGPLTNRFGRKPTLYYAIGLEIISALLCSFAAPLHSFDLLVVARLLMALGASVGLKMTFTIIADSYPQDQATHIISRLLLAFAITPGLGITIGGYLVELLNWQSCFYFLALYGVLLLFLCMRLPETSKKLDHTALYLSSLIKNYYLQIKNSQLVLCAVMVGCASTFIYLFAALAPFIAMNLLQMDPAHYGLFNLLPPLGMIAGSFLAAHLARSVLPLKAIIVGIIISCLGALLMLGAFLVHWINPYTLFLPMAVSYVGLSVIFANASGLATSQATDKSNASAMMNFLNMGFCVVCVLLAGLMTKHAAIIMPIIYCGLILILYILYHFLKPTSSAAKA